MTHPQQHPNTASSAALSFGAWPASLYGVPHLDGDTIVVGHFSHSQLPVTLDSQSAEWLDGLIDALTAARDKLYRERAVAS